jgi:hypothetical protein
VQNLLLPHILVQEFCYFHEPWVYVFGTNLKIMSHFYLYHEGQAKIGPNEIHSLLLDYITNHIPENVKEGFLLTAVLAERETILLSDSLQC